MRHICMSGNFWKNNKVIIAGIPVLVLSLSASVFASSGAVTGGLAGLYYGYGRIPADWLAVRSQAQRLDRRIV